MHVGSFVRVTRAAIGDERDNYGYWVASMDRTIGDFGIVRDIQLLTDGQVEVFIPRRLNSFWYPPQCLAEIECPSGHAPNNQHIENHYPPPIEPL
jgi:hypothetical protein